MWPFLIIRVSKNYEIGYVQSLQNNVIVSLVNILSQNHTALSVYNSFLNIKTTDNCRHCSGWLDSNQRPPAPEAEALARLRAHYLCVQTALHPF